MFVFDTQNFVSISKYAGALLNRYVEGPKSMAKHINFICRK